MANNNWQSRDIPDLNGKVIIVTGGNSGLGYESVKSFAQKGASVVMASRSREKAEKAKAEIIKLAPHSDIDILSLDLMDLASVASFANAFSQKYDRLDVLLNNAGIMMTPFQHTKDGFESQLGTNHLGHFALTGRLFPHLQSTPASRVVNVSSLAHRRGDMDFDNLQYENGRDYSPIKSYGRSKLANLLFTYEMHRRLEAAGLNILSVAAHPGGSQTNLANHLEGKWWFKLLWPIVTFMMQTAEQGAMPQVRASVGTTVKGGEYYGPDGRGEMTGKAVLVQSTPLSHDPEAGRRLWDISEQLTGVQFLS
ncbi:MAG: oxidoreductase [Bacteroidota bacterium]